MGDGFAVHVSRGCLVAVLVDVGAEGLDWVNHDC